MLSDTLILLFMSILCDTYHKVERESGRVFVRTVVIEHSSMKTSFFSLSYTRVYLPAPPPPIIGHHGKMGPVCVLGLPLQRCPDLAHTLCCSSDFC